MNAEIKIPDFVLNKAKQIAKKHGISIEELTGRCRIKEFMPARKEFAYYLYEEVGYSLQKTGAMLSGREHGSVINLIKKHKILLNKNKNEKNN